MFYAASLLSMKSNTQLSLLYFVSTTRRVSRKSLHALDIHSLLEELENPPQPFALRLYSYLVVGVVRVYLFKLKAYENEVLSLLNSLSFQGNKGRIREKVRREENLLEESEGEESRGECNSQSLLSLEVEEDVNYKRIKIDSRNRLDSRLDRDKDKDRFDTFTEYSNCSKFCLKTFGMTQSNRHSMSSTTLPLKEYKIIKLFEREIHPSTTHPSTTLPPLEVEDLSFDLDPIEKMRSSSLLTHSTTVEQSLFKEENLEGKIFNSVNVGSRLSRVVNFYHLLEKCSKGEIVVFQKEAYGEILIG